MYIYYYNIYILIVYMSCCTFYGAVIESWLTVQTDGALCN